MTDEEHDIFVSLARQISRKLQNAHDNVQNSILVGYLEVMLNYCLRFYNRQFLTRKIENTDILTRFDRLLHGYFHDKLQLTKGLPTVQYRVGKLCMSPNYFGDLVKKTPGDTASNYIRQYVIQEAKNALASGTGIAQVAYSLGFEHQQHLSRMFKKITGVTPTEYQDGLKNIK